MDFKRIIGEPINILLGRATDSSSGEGDLTRKIDIKSKDEFAQVSDKFNLFIEKSSKNG